MIIVHNYVDITYQLLQVLGREINGPKPGDLTNGLCPAGRLPLNKILHN